MFALSITALKCFTTVRRTRFLPSASVNTRLNLFSQAAPILELPLQLGPGIALDTFRSWAFPESKRRLCIHNYCFAARSHSAILDGFISHYRKLVMNLGMFDQKQCEPDSSELDYTGKVLVLSPNTLKEEYWSPENQLWLAQSGFGCSPTARGRSILCVCLGDGEQTRWNRNDFIGVLKDEYLPDWAKESLKQYQRAECKSFCSIIKPTKQTSS